MLVTMREILPGAVRNRTAVPAFNVDTVEIAQAVYDVINETGCPSIIAVGQGAIKDGKLELLAGAVKILAGKTQVPTVLHLDHGRDNQQVREALMAGFSSVMIDGSRLSLQENIETTRETVRLAQKEGASVEAELGCILGQEDEISSGDKPYLVRVQDVIDFTKAVTVDALAIGIGNAHGLYKGRPNFDFVRLAECREATDVPLVLHGGSGTPEDMIRKSIETGIRKINIATEIRNAYVDGLLASAEKEYYAMVRCGKEKVREVCRKKIALFTGCSSGGE